MHAADGGRWVASLGVTVDSRLEHIKFRLASIRFNPVRGLLNRTLPKILLPHGSDSHRYKLNEPLSESEVVAFERKHNIRLPEEYRQFLLKLGNGGAGPNHGILPLEQWNDALLMEIDNPRVASPKFGILESECPLKHDIKYGENWLEELGEVEYGAYQGTISVSHQGCSYFSLLVITGKSRGRIVNIDMDYQPPYFDPHPDFLSWYEDWLK